MIIAPTPIDAAPTVPVRGDRVNFAAQTQAWIAWEKVAYPQSVALGLNVYANAVETYNNAAVAQAAASAASAAVNALPWAAGTAWAQFDTVISLVDYQRYTRTAVSPGVNATDPANEITGRWVNTSVPPQKVIDTAVALTMRPGPKYRVTAACSVSLPAPADWLVGDRVYVVKLGAFPVTVLRNGNTVDSRAVDISLDIAKRVFTIQRVGGAVGVEIS